MRSVINHGVSTKVLITMLLLCVWMPKSMAQKYESDKNEIVFFSEAPLENIEATTQDVFCSLDTQTGEVKAKLGIETFDFEKALMKQHFNEQYMESHKYPSAFFEGKVVEVGKLQNKKDGSYNVNGELLIHGVKNPVSAMVKILFQEDTVIGNSTFMVKTADYKIKIPQVVVKNIAEEIEVRLIFKLLLAD